MSTKKVSQDRKARLAEIQKQQKAKERKVVIGIVIGCVALLVALGGVVAYAISDAKSKQLPNLGVSAGAARCDPVTTDPPGGTGDHVGPGTPSPDQTRVDYQTSPPSSGAHFAAPDLSGQKFYTAADRPPLETLVHNLEHGYTVLWYDGAKAKGKEQLLRDIADQANRQPQAQGTFLVVEWDSSRGQFPADKPYALAHWAKDAGKRQFCGDLSGAAVVDFITDFPASDNPESGAG